jgi:hypothetical protein
VAVALRDEGKPGDKPAERAVEELIAQAIKEVTMHEVGHTLGLRHNFKASTMLKNEDLHNKAITREKGLVGSVMDYAPVNLAPKGVKQGDYFTTTLGPYDYWAIEYAYKPLSGGTEGEYEKLQEIAKKGAAPGHDFGTDEDLYGSADPLINVWDLGADPMKFAQDRILLAEELLKGLADKATEKGAGYQHTRQAFTMVLQEYGNGAHLIGNFVGGVVANRDHKGDPNGRDPFVPIKAEKQREALKFLQEHILTDKTFQYSPQLLRRLAAERWMHWGTNRAMGSGEYPIHEQILAIQRVALRHLFNPRTLSRIQNAALNVDKSEKPLTVAEVFRDVTDGVWNDAPTEAKKPLASSVVRRNLQRQHVQELSTLVLGPRAASRLLGGSGGMVTMSGGAAAPPDARSLARMHLREIGKRIEKLTNDKAVTLDDTTRAHLEECQERIAKVLSASMQVNE